MQNVVSENLAMLSKFSKSLKTYKLAVDSFSKRENERHIADNLRLAIELLLKDVLSSDKNLDNQKSELGVFLKSIGYSNELRNIFNTQLAILGKYQNENVKHNDKVNINELDFVFHFSSTIIRAILIGYFNINKSDDVVDESWVQFIKTNIAENNKYQELLMRGSLAGMKRVNPEIYSDPDGTTNIYRHYIFDIEERNISKNLLSIIKEVCNQNIIFESIATTHKTTFLYFIILHNATFETQLLSETLMGKLENYFQRDKLKIYLINKDDSMYEKWTKVWY